MGDLITEKRSCILPETSKMEPEHLKSLARCRGPHGAWSRGARCLARGSRCEPFRNLSPKCLCLLIPLSPAGKGGDFLSSHKKTQAQEVKGPSQSAQPGRPGSQPTTHWNPTLADLTACSREGQLFPSSCLKLPRFSSSCLPVLQTPLEQSTKETVTPSACLCFPGISPSSRDLSFKMRRVEVYIRASLTSFPATTSHPTLN